MLLCIYTVLESDMDWYRNSVDVLFALAHNSSGRACLLRMSYLRLMEPICVTVSLVFLTRAIDIANNLTLL